MICLHEILGQHGNHHLSVFGIVLVPSTITSFAKAGEGDGGNRDDVETLHQEPVGKWPVIVPRRFQPDPDRSRKAFQESDQPIMICPTVGDLEMTAVTSLITDE